MLTDWLMVIITAIYVVATIFICIYNGHSAKAAKEQTEEMIAQYNSVNRPCVTVRFDVIRSGLLCFIIENEGPLPAKNVRISINEEFLNNIRDGEKEKLLNNLNDANFYLASKQKLTVLLGGTSDFNDISKEIAKINIAYNDYKEYAEIDISQYAFMILYNSSLEDISQHLKTIKEEEKRYHKDLLKIINKPHISNIVVYSATEDDANKFNLFKLVCLHPNSTAVQLSEKMNMDKEYISGLLSELSKVDGLISFAYGDDYKEENLLWFKR
ncbi:MAG: hypothetical protein IKB55_01870 [Clostridia bacterium]|nr:hypothetical protein [Clostridia bacterium]